MKNNIKKAIKCVLLLGVFFCCLCASAQENKKVRIISQSADVRSAPALYGIVLGKVTQGETFPLLGEADNWYKIAFTDADGSSREGFVHRAISQIVKPSAKKEMKKEVKKAVKKEKKQATASKSLAPEANSGYIAKFGLSVSSRQYPQAPTWLLSFGYDYGINPYLSAGLEIQPYLRNSTVYFSDDRVMKFHYLVTQAFVNFKVGSNLSSVSGKLDPVRVYAGAGIGPQIVYTWGKENENSLNDFNLYLSWHVLAGFSVQVKSLQLILEYQGIQVFHPDVEIDRFQHLVLLGIKF